MSFADPEGQLELPKKLEAQLHDFRKFLWKIKLIEAVCVSIAGLFTAYLVVFVLDRLWDTPAVLRGIILLGALGICGFLPSAVYQWVWKHRHPEQLARLLSRKLPRIGDQLLGVIELVRSKNEQSRSRDLCAAAIKQVAIEAGRRDFREAIPSPRHRMWSRLAVIPVSIAIVLCAISGSAAINAWTRFSSPWRATPRYTYAGIEKLPDPYIVPHGEPLRIELALMQNSLWKPREGSLQAGKQPPSIGRLRGEKYEFAVTPQISETFLKVQIGDASQKVRMVPTIRPELTALHAEYSLPEYLGRAGSEKRDAHGGSISFVKGTKVRLTAQASRDLASARVNGEDVVPKGSTISLEPMSLSESSKIEFEWKDGWGLLGKAPFTLDITVREDEAPTVACEDLPRQKVILNSEQLTFAIHAQDDFGVKRVGIEWNGLQQDGTPTNFSGERILGGGGIDRETLELSGTFSATSLGIEPQPLRLRIFAEDYLPGRSRAYSLPCTLFILAPDEHAVWITDQMNKWHRQALEVRDRELQLYDVNKQLRALTPEELDRPENRRKVEQQSQAERTNGRRLTGLVASGEELVRQASRNPEFGVGHLEKWAEMMQVLKEISGNRMPSVADLLKEGAQASLSPSGSDSSNSKVAGEVKSIPEGKPDVKKGEQKTPPENAPQIADVESALGSKGPGSQNDKPSENSDEAEESQSPGGGLFLPKTMVADTSDSASKPQSQTSAEKKIEEAVKQQEGLLAEFDKVSQELERVLANLEGSTLVKRLKAASRNQYRIGGEISQHIGDSFGIRAEEIQGSPEMAFKDLRAQELKASQEISFLMDDLQAYLERRQLVRFQTVLDEMRKEDVIGGLRQLGDDLKKENGLSLAQSEYWSDTFDRWAEDLTDPSCAGKCPGSKSKGSLPPSIILEVLQILEGEVNLRDETRVTQQSKPVVSSEVFGKKSGQLSGTQKTLRDRIQGVIGKIELLPDAEQDFGKELRLLGLVSGIMGETVEILARPETGNPAIAAETEAIELLLQSKKFNPKSRGGGGGSTPGGGGEGTTTDSALALTGSGVNPHEVREDHQIDQSTGEIGSSLPEEFRAGLDEYFNRLEREAPGSARP